MIIDRITEQAFFRYNPWWEDGQKYQPPNLFPRPEKLTLLKKSFDLNKIIALTGLRRIGKTSLIKLSIEWLIKSQNVNPNNILYLSVDDYLFKDWSIPQLVDAFRRINNLDHKQKLYLFFDEITFQKNYELHLKNLFDLQQATIVISSSCASLLRSKKPLLTGRVITHLLEPLNFEEYLQFKKIKISKRDSQLVYQHFENYLHTGGIPEYVLTGSQQVVKELIEDIIKKDIVSRYKIANEAVLTDFFLLLAQRAGSLVSINKLAKVLGISPDTASRYLKMFEEAYLINLMPKYGKPNQKILAPKKLYLPDTGLKNIYADNASLGGLFENYLYLQLKQHTPHYLVHDGAELDFFIYPDTVIEAKYNSQLSANQQKAFDSFSANQKMVINGYDDLGKLARLVKKS